jgi:hypothetical protein
MVFPSRQLYGPPLPSAQDDPAPIVGPNVAGITWDTERWLAITVTVDRLASSAIINTILPVSICAFLGFTVLIIPYAELFNRLQMIAVVFVALTALQVVLKQDQPSSNKARYLFLSYSDIDCGAGNQMLCMLTIMDMDAYAQVLPTQKYILTTYALLFLVTFESIVVQYVFPTPERDAWHQDGRYYYKVASRCRPGVNVRYAGWQNKLSRWRRRVKRDEIPVGHAAYCVEVAAFVILLCGFVVVAILIFIGEL